MSQPNHLFPELIDQWLYRLAHDKDEARAQETARLLSITLRKSLMRDPALAEQLTTLPAGAPEWAQNKWDTGGPFHRFVPDKDPDLTAKVNHVADWLISAQVHDADFLKDTQDGKPKLLMQIGSLDHACKRADVWGARLRKTFAQQASPDGAHVVMQFEDGMRIVELPKVEHLRNEGGAMQHCVGDGAYDKPLEDGIIRIYSLRDPQNKPHVTFQVFEMKDQPGHLRQCTGKQNEPPVAKYIPYVQAFVRREKFEIMSGAQRGVLLVQDVDKNYHDPYKLPEHCTLPGFSTRHFPGIRLPDNLTVRGDCELIGYAHATLPRKLTVGVDLDIIRSAVTALPDDLNAGWVKVTDSPLKELPEKPPISGGLAIGYDIFSVKDWDKARAFVRGETDVAKAQVVTKKQEGPVSSALSKLRKMCRFS